MSDDDFLRNYDPQAFARPSITVDLVLLSIRGGRPSVLLMRRTAPPQADRWALPGGFVGIDEDLEAAAARVARDKAGIEGARLEQLYTFGAVDRDPRMRIVTVAYLGLMEEGAFEDALRDTPDRLGAVLEIGPTGEGFAARSPRGEALPLAFDHAEILAAALMRLRGKLDWSDVGFSLLPERFTLRQLQEVHEAILGTSLNKPAFRRRMLDKGWIAPTGAREEGASFRPAELFRFQPNT
ncbi:NUDIX hydrolase [Antarcticirhabdus aurantiaca]|uniref:NUDIX domain-containing protein n=1 Tax=Antarcticirhabdus aurantiaca TaxID=2606717 RepID=A0ACD4NU10_9HYPH|nr:NUDIX domain-containing protein [Antarcticirhabdus aurantiaca]WAJ30351.1 NUDIX domain-containing protein [Jeongeuplla avenae]